MKLARNAKSVSLDLKQPAGRELFLRLVSAADVVIENFSARAMPSMDLGYDVLQAHNPRLIYVTMPGYGTYGPYKDWVAFGPTVEPMTGLSQMLGYSYEEPRNSAMALMDPIAGTTATTALVSALRKRQETGQGSLVELSLHECGVSFNGPWLLDQQLGGDLAPLGNAHPQMSPHGVYPCLTPGADDDADWVAVACQDQQAWAALASLLEAELSPEWTLEQRMERSSVIDAALSHWTRQYDKDAAAARLQQCGQFFATYERYETPTPGNPIHMEGLSQEDWTPCPPLGAHSQMVLQQWLGLSAEETQKLLEDEVIAERPPD